MTDLTETIEQLADAWQSGHEPAACRLFVCADCAVHACGEDLRTALRGNLPMTLWSKDVAVGTDTEEGK